MRPSAPTALADRRCAPCRPGSPTLDAERTRELLDQLAPGWAFNNEGHLERSFAFKDFKGALKLADRIGAIADAEDHHPELHVGWGRCRVELWTHAAGGLTENDFVLAAKIDRARG